MTSASAVDPATPCGAVRPRPSHPSSLLEDGTRGGGPCEDCDEAGVAGLAQWPLGVVCPEAGSEAGCGGAGGGGGGAGGGSSTGAAGTSAEASTFCCPEILICLIRLIESATLLKEETVASGLVLVKVVVWTALLDGPELSGKLRLKRPGVSL